MTSKLALSLQKKTPKALDAVTDVFLQGPWVTVSDSHFTIPKPGVLYDFFRLSPGNACAIRNHKETHGVVHQQHCKSRAHYGQT